MAQPQQENDNWKQRMQSEKIAYITTRLQLTPEEAQVFWPVYNQVSTKKDEAFGNCGKAMAELEKAIKEGKSDKEIEKLLNTYVTAQSECEAANSESVEAYSKVLPAGKVARLIVTEEHFRRHMFQKMQQKQGNPGGQQHFGGNGQRPDFRNGQRPEGQNGNRAR